MLHTIHLNLETYITVTSCDLSRILIARLTISFSFLKEYAKKEIQHGTIALSLKIITIY